MFLLLWQQKPRNKFCHDTFHAKILLQNLGHSSSGTPRSAPSSHAVSHQPLLTATIHTQHARCLPVAGLAERGSLSWFSAVSEAFAHLYLCCTHCITPKSRLHHLNSFRGGMFKLNTKLDIDSLLYSPSHFECDGHTVHTLTQQHLPPPLTSAVKLSLFTHVHSSPLSLAARLHGCCANHSHYINNGWTFVDRPRMSNIVLSLTPIWNVLLFQILHVVLVGIHLKFEK